MYLDQFRGEHNPVIHAMEHNGKLPNEDQVRGYLDQFITADPAVLKKFMPSVDELIQKDLKRPPKDPDDWRYNWHDPGKWPIEVDSAWIATSFGCDLPNCPKPQIQMKEAGSPTREVDHRGQWPKVFVKQMQMSANDCCRLATDKASSGRSFRMPYKMSQAFDTYHSTQRNRMHALLRENGFTAKRGEPELTQEILTRKKQFPGWKIYAFLGEEMVNYFGNVYQTYKWHDAFLISMGGNDSCDSYESAVVAECQIRASHEFHFHYWPERIPRWWVLHFGSLMKFGIEVDKRIDEEKQIEGKPTLTQVRFANLE